MGRLRNGQMVTIVSDRHYRYDTDTIATIVSQSTEYTDYLVETEDGEEFEVERHQIEF